MHKTLWENLVLYEDDGFSIWGTLGGVTRTTPEIFDRARFADGALKYLPGYILIHPYDEEDLEEQVDTGTFDVNAWPIPANVDWCGFCNAIWKGTMGED